MDLVIGSSGCLGAAVCAALLRSGRAVRALDTVATGVPGVDERIGDMGDATRMDEVLRGVDTVHQCASAVSLHPDRRAWLWEMNVAKNRTVLDASRRAGVRAFVYASTQVLCVRPGEPARGIDERVPYADRPLSAFAACRIASEKDVLAANDPGAGLRTLALRVPSIYGARDRYHLPLHLRLADQGLAIRAGDQRHCSHVYAENAAHAHVLAGDALRAGAPGGAAYYLSDETPPPSYWDIMEELLVASGRKPFRGTIPRPVFAALAHISEALHARLGRVFPGEPRFSYEGLLVAASDCWFRTDAIRRDLGWAPPVARDEAVRRTARWFATNPWPKTLV